jgi:hypothetical protein
MTVGAKVSTQAVYECMSESSHPATRQFRNLPYCSKHGHWQPIMSMHLCANGAYLHVTVSVLFTVSAPVQPAGTA